ncbi:SCO family protein [Pedobacter faecalis]|uniref:SCO family protein n=1 Tax=Pedobacter faecalis TaxID=3041495 RepID=UPI00254F6FD1|nr:SCO family protein [Pedobacter sp. ELA7]
MKLFNFLACLLILASPILLPSCKEEKPLPVLGQKPISDFSFLNQDSVAITNKTFGNKIYIADFFFTSCTTICPIMHRNMKDLYEDFQDRPELMFLSHTIDFKYDKPSALKRYAKKLGVDDGRWQFVYGSKDSVYTIAEKDYLVTVMEDSTAKENYVHAGYFVLIDGKRQIRGVYDGTDDKQVAQLRKDIPVLLKEVKN